MQTTSQMSFSRRGGGGGNEERRKQRQRHKSNQSPDDILYIQSVKEEGGENRNVFLLKCALNVVFANVILSFCAQVDVCVF